MWLVFPRLAGKQRRASTPNHRDVQQQHAQNNHVDWLGYFRTCFWNTYKPISLNLHQHVYISIYIHIFLYIVDIPDIQYTKTSVAFWSFWTFNSWDPSPRPFSSLHRHCLLALFSSRGAGSLAKRSFDHRRIKGHWTAKGCIMPDSFLCDHCNLEVATRIAGMVQGSEIADSTEDCGLWT